MDWLLDPFRPPFMQRALLEAALLALAGGLLGTWIVLRRLSFFTHAAGSATFPGLAVAGSWSIAPPLAGLGAALLFAAGLARLRSRARIAAGTATGLLLVGFLAAGTILASDVYPAGAGVDRLLFGSIVAVGDGDLVLAGVVAAVVAVAFVTAGRSWLLAGFDPQAAGHSGARADWLLLMLIAAAVVAALQAVGALLASALLVMPAASARISAPSVRALARRAVVLALLQAVVGLWLAYRLDVAPGPAIALLGLVIFAAAAGFARAGRTAGFVVLAATLTGVAIGGCGGDAPAEPAKLRIVATTPVAADLVRAVAGRRAELVLLPGTSARIEHRRPSSADAAALENADIVVRAGAGTDAFLSPALEEAGDDVIDLDLAKSVVLREAAPGVIDPHWWLDPLNVIAATGRLRDVLGRLDPDGARPYRRGARRQTARVRALERALVACFSRLPASTRVVAAGHDAYGYLATRLRLRVAATAMPGLTTRRAASPAQLDAAARAASAAGVEVVLAGNGDARAAAGLAGRIGGRVVRVRADDLAAVAPRGQAYVRTLRSDVRGLLAALGGGTCPEAAR